MKTILKILLGNIRTGKTTFCINESLKRIEKGLKTYIIVPEQYTLQLERKLLESSDVKSLLDVEVFGFERFAYNYFEKSGSLNKKNINEVTKLMLIKKILLENKEDLKYYKSSINKQGFIVNVSQIFKEFHQSSINKETLQQLLKKLEENGDISSTYSKLVDLKLVYEKYMEYIGKEYVETDDILNILSREIKKEDNFENYNFYIDSFVGFTVAELNVIEKLLKIGCDLTITLPIDVSIVNEESLYDYYYEPKKTYNQLLNIAKKNNIYTENVVLEEVAIKNEQIQFLKENYFSEKKIYNKKCENIKIFSELNKYDEVEKVSKLIKHLVVNENYKYKDFALITGDIEQYESVLKASFNKFEIPLFIDKKRNILFHQLVEFIRSLIDVSVSNWSYESVFRLLKTDLFDFSVDEVQTLENYVLEWGIRGYKWGIEWKYGFKGDSETSYDEKYNKIEINSLREKIVGIINIFANKLNYKSNDTILNFSKKIFNVFYAINIEEKIEELERCSKQEGLTDLQDVHTKIWNKLCDMFDEMVSVLGDKKVSLIEFKNILDSGLISVDIGLIPQTQDQVIFGNIRRTKIENKKHIILIGCNDGNIPEISTENGLLLDHDIEIINNFEVEFKEKTENLNLANNFLIYSVLLKATEKIILTYSNSTLQGKTLFKSSVVQKLQKMFNLKENEELEFNLPPKYLFNDIGNIFRELTEGNIDDVSMYDKQLLMWFMNNERYKEKVNNLILAKETVLSMEKLSKNTIDKLYGNEIISSITKLEKYVQCPFAYFMRYNLNAKERKLFQLNNLDFGNLFHDVLDKFITNNEVLGKDYNLITSEDIEDFVEKNIDDIINASTNEIYIDNERNKYFIVRIKRICKKSLWALTQHIKAGDFVPKKTEFEFSFNKPYKGITINLNDGKTLVITGKVDRIDVCTSDGKQYVEVIDYKSSKKSVNISDIYYGTQLQLMTYLDVIIKNSEELLGNAEITETGGIFYFNVHDPIIEDDKLIEKIIEKLNDENNKEVQEIIDEKTLKQFRLEGLINEDIEVIKKFDKKMSKESDIVPIKFTKDNDIHSTYKKNAFSNKDFEIIRKYCYNKIADIGNEIVDGQIGVMPIKFDNYNSCTYCEYSSVCKIDTIDEQLKYKEFEKLTKDDALAKMQVEKK